MKNIPPEKLRYLDEMKVKLRGSTDPALIRSNQHLVIEWLGESFGRTTIRGVELVSDEHAMSASMERLMQRMQRDKAMPAKHFMCWRRAKCL